MDLEERRIYNKEYYEKNRNKILQKACSKVKCEFCDRNIILNNLLKHQQSSICKKKSILKFERERRLRELQELANQTIEPVNNDEEIQTGNVKNLINKFENKNLNIE